jgi:hypothetical protein
MYSMLAPRTNLSAASIIPILSSPVCSVQYNNIYQFTIPLFPHPDWWSRKVSTTETVKPTRLGNDSCLQVLQPLLCLSISF